MLGSAVTRTEERHMMTPGTDHRFAQRWIAVLAALAMVSCGNDSAGFSLGAEAQVDISPRVIDFGDVARGASAVQLVTVRHVGTTGTIRLDPIMLETESLDLTVGLIEATSLEPGEETRIQVVYNSDHDEPDRGELVIGHNLADNPESRVTITTPGQRAVLVTSPTIVDFGIVQAGAPATRVLDVLNGGTAPATLTGFELEDDEDDDFSVNIPPNTVIEPGGRGQIEITYSPEERNNDTATLILLTEREDVKAQVVLYGEEETPVLRVEPSLVQLGWTEPGDSSSRRVTILNEGNTDLDISTVELRGAAPNLFLLNRPTGPFSLAPGQGHEMDVLFEPNEEVPMTPDPLATIHIESNDEANNPSDTPVFGAAGVPSIRVVPESIVDFAFVAQGFTAKRVVVLINEGNSAIDITDARLVDPSSTEFGFPSANLLPKRLNPGETLELELTFENAGDAEGTEDARFFINTSDPVVPEYPLDVVARRAQRPTCEPAFVPELLAFGALRPGDKGTRTMKVVNFGSGNCEYQEYDMSGCLAVQAGIRQRFECDSQIAFNAFEVKSAPPFGTVVGPGESLDIEVEFVAPPLLESSTNVGRDSYYARIALFMFDPNSSLFEFVAPPGGWGRGVNLRGETAVPIVSVDPPAVNFGLVRTDCQSSTARVTVTARGPLAATVTDLELIGCDGVQLNAPATPFTVDGFSTVAIDAVYVPGTVGNADCTLRITNDSDNLPVADVSLKGQATDVLHNIDAFDQVPPPKVDVLFVIDDSFSMGDDQQRLKQELPKMVGLATMWGQDYHLGVTTTDTILVRGEFQGYPPYATPVLEPEVFAQNMVVGTAGHYEERGLEGAWLALYQRAARTDIMCENVPNACPTDDGDGYPLICLEGQCSGRNWGFVRDDAELVIIVVSDEEDSSERSNQFYINQFAALKAFHPGVGVTMHAIVVTEEGCFGFGTPGFRYMQVAEALNGKVASICADDFAAEFASVAQETFGLSDRFYPTLPPDPATLEVRVNGTPCTSGWTWNQATQAVIFTEGSACFPEFNDQVELEYDVFCVEPAP